MRVAFIILVSFLLSAAPLLGAARRDHTWAVAAPPGVDARIEHQLEALAARDQALIQFFHSPGQAERYRLHPGNLVIELHEERNINSFVKALRSEGGALSTQSTRELAREGYILEASYPRASVPNRLRITAAGAAGFHHALLRVPDLLVIWPSSLPSRLVPRPQAIRVERGGTEVVISDFPSFPERGIVEGFYGVPWSHQDRVDILRFEGQHGMNVYYYAPKDDPYHRKLWRDPYPADEMKRLAELVKASQANFVDFCFAISPGLSMTYSSDEDFRVLTSKLESVGKLGISCYALFLDDVPQDFQNAADQARFKTLAEAHVYLVNRLGRHLKSQSPENRLTVTPTVYTNEWGRRDYIKELGAGVDPGVNIVWTGTEVASPAITVAQAREWGRFLERKPLLWDNFPVNDGRPWRVFLGPVRNRDANLPVAVEGLFSNPMNQSHASMIALETVADYLWNSQAYDPAKSQRHAVESQFGKNASQLLATFLKTYGDYWWDENIFTPLFLERRYPIDVTKIDSGIAQLDSALGPLRSQPRFEKLVAEISPFPQKTRERLAKVTADPAFLRLADGKLRWREDYDLLTAAKLAATPNIDGDFRKWENGPLYVLDNASKIRAGANLWQGPAQLSARVALGWDDDYLYVGVDVTNPQLYQPFFERGIEKGDGFEIDLETAFQKNFLAIRPAGDEYSLWFSPGDFKEVKPSVFSDEDYLPLRPRKHDYNREIKSAWKKTAHGYSGDLAIPVSFFDGGKFKGGYEIGLAFNVQKVFPSPQAVEQEDLQRIVFTSKADQLFRASINNPSSLQRLVLVEVPAR
jgi:hypothetical protein